MNTKNMSPILKRKRWKLTAHDQRLIVACGNNERFVHPLMKAFIWALYLPDYPTSSIEIRIGDRYKPDVVAFAPDAGIYSQPAPLFWGEAGKVGRDKIFNIVRRFPDTHFAMSKWDTRLQPYAELVTEAMQAVPNRSAPFDLIRFYDDDVRFVDADGNITITHDDVEWQRIEPR